MSVSLIDGDLVAYRASVAAQDDTDWGDGLGDQPSANTPAAVRNAHHLIEKWHDESGCDKIAVCFSPRDGANFRRLIGPYKEGRDGKPLAYWPVVEAIEETYKTVRIPWLEADDVMGILSTSPKMKGAVIVTIDKDLKTIPGRLFNPMRDKKPQIITESAADLFWMTQTLTGDRVDGYFGLPGVGPAKAAKILDGLSTLQQMWTSVSTEYLARGQTLDDALLQARFARILRRDDYDSESEVLKLWHLIPKRRPTLELSRLSLESMLPPAEAGKEKSLTS